ncbi:MAG: hypothetical protein R3A13_12900 [Bdellovibrionota bacterium]
MHEKDINLKTSRHQLDVLISCKNSTVVSTIRHALSSVGFIKLTSRSEFNEALEEAKQRAFELVFFDANSLENGQTESNFVEDFIALQSEAVLIAVSTEPSAENIFKTIRHGARGYMIAPFTPESVENVILRACEDPKIDQEILDDPNRNRALARFIISKYNRLTEFMRDVKLESQTTEEFEQKLIAGIDTFSVMLAHSVRVSKLFVNGTDEDLAEAIVDALMENQKSKTRLGSMRERLKQKRVVEEPGTAAA